MRKKRGKGGGRKEREGVVCLGSLPSSVDVPPFADDLMRGGGRRSPASRSLPLVNQVWTGVRVEIRWEKTGKTFVGVWYFHIHDIYQVKKKKSLYIYKLCVDAVKSLEVHRLRGEKKKVKSSQF